MYLNYYGLARKPFSITPDPRFLYLSNKHREGLAHLLYGTSADSSFVVLTGEIGTGKTMLSRALLHNPAEDLHVALVLNSLQTPIELLSTICDEFSIGYRETTNSRKILIDRINAFLLQRYAQNHRCILIIDEAQNLSVETLEQVRLLTNLESGEHKLLKIILIGQPELKDLLDRPELRQLNQRVTGRHHLLPLDEKETGVYITHRMIKAGGAADVFSQQAARQIHKLSGGIPRLINLIADRALLGGYALNQPHIDKKLVNVAGGELVELRKKRFRFSLATALSATGIFLGILAISLAMWNLLSTKTTSTAIQTVPPAQTEEKTDTPALSPTNNPVVEPVAAAIEATDDSPDAGTQNTVVAQSIEQSEYAAEDESVSPITQSEPTLRELLARQMNSPSAIDSLFIRWGIPPKSLGSGTACEIAQSENLGCIVEKGGFSQLVNYDRPAVLELDLGDSERHQILLSGLEGNKSLVMIDGKSSNVHTDELLQYWNGEYLLFWKLPPNGKKILKPGDRGKSITWLNRLINQVQGKPEDADTIEVYTESLQQKIKEFQIASELEADGVAGPETLIKLSTLTRDSATPTLIQRSEAGEQ